MEITYASVCDVGKCRKENQDSIFAKTGDNWGIFVLADGMGGHSNGAWASEEITAAYADWIEETEKYLDQCDIQYLFSELRRVLSEVNNKIFQGTAKGEVCGSTAVVLFIIRDQYILLAVGDSRCYEIPKKLLKRSFRKMSVDEICTIPGQNYGKLINAVGTRIPLRCNLISGTVKKRDAFLLCSDGIYKLCSEDELLAVVKKCNDDLSKKNGEEIKRLIYQKGANDNFSAIIINVCR